MCLTRGEEVILQLGRFKGYDFDQYCMPFGLTQDGIAVAIGISRAHVSIELKKLIENRYVTYQQAHIKKNSSKRNVYMLTSKGLDRISMIEKKMDDEGIIMESIFFDEPLRFTKSDANIEMAYRKLLTSVEMVSNMVRDPEPNTYPVVNLLMEAIKNLAYRDCK